MLCILIVLQCHWPVGWSRGMVSEYLQLLARLTEIILQDNEDLPNAGIKNMLLNIVTDFHSISKQF